MTYRTSDYKGIKLLLCWLSGYWMCHTDSTSSKKNTWVKITYTKTAEIGISMMFESPSSAKGKVTWMQPFSSIFYPPLKQTITSFLLFCCWFSYFVFGKWKDIASISESIVLKGVHVVLNETFFSSKKRSCCECVWGITHSTPSEYLFNVLSLDFKALSSYKMLKTSSALETCTLGTAQFLETLFFSYNLNGVFPTGVIQNFKGRK